MTIQEAIQKAVEGCYLETSKWLPEHKADVLAHLFEVKEKLLLTPLFWSALGKSLGWGWGRADDGLNLQPRWQVKWHRLIDHLASGKSIEDYFNNL